jgi:hypothetical protein
MAETSRRSLPTAKRHVQPAQSMFKRAFKPDDICWFLPDVLPKAIGHFRKLPFQAVSE